MVQERTITLGCAIAMGLWSLMAVTLIAGMICAFTSSGHGHGLAATLTLMTTGLTCAIGAGTLTMRNAILTQTRLQQNAFRLGEESGLLRRVR